MKRLYSIILAGLTFLSFSSCNKEGDGPKGSVLEAVVSNLKIPAKGGEATISLITTEDFEVAVDKDWCTMSVENLFRAGKSGVADSCVVSITAPVNESFESRYSRVTVRTSDETLNFSVQQFGWYTSGFAPEDITTSSDAAEFDFPYEFDEQIVASTDADWITLTSTGENLHVAIAENTIEGTPDNPARSAEISWALGFETGVIRVTQNNLSFMKVDSNWDVHYDGVQKYNDEDAAIISNDVITEGISGKYAIYYSEKAGFTASGMTMDDYVLEVAAECRDELFEAIDYYSQLGINLTFADFLYEASDFEVFNPLDPGEYIAFAIGYDDEAVMTGHYAYKEFKVSGGSGATGYDAWLGEWETKRGSVTDTWTITADQAGSTYIITGIEGQNIPVAASYLTTTQGIEVRAQADLGTISTSNYGECTVGLYGGWSTSSFATGTYPIFTGKISGDTASLTPEKVSLSDGNSYMLERVQYVATTSDGKYLTISKDKTPLPTTLTRKGGSGGDNPGGDGSENYNRFIGSWSVNSENDAFSISLTQKNSDASFNMKGWQMDEDFFEPLEVTYNSDGTITLNANSSEPFATNVDIGADEGPCNMYMVGKFIYSDGNEYYIDGGSSWYNVATGTMKGDGTIEFKGNEVNLQEGGTFEFCRMEIFAIPISDPDGGAYTFRNRPSEFPLTAAKAGRSSVKANGMMSGEWVRIPDKSVRMAQPACEAYQSCVPYQAVPELPLRVLKHVR